MDIAGAILPGGGLAGAVVALLMWFGRVTREDRKEYREQLAVERARVRELDTAMDVEIGDLRRRIADVQTVADGERERRRDSEILGEKLRMQLASSESRTEWLTQELGRRGSANYPPYMPPSIEATT